MMKMKQTVFVLMFLFSISASAQTGMGVNMPLVGRLVGGGGVLFRTALDVTNHTTRGVRVDFFLDGQNLSSGAPFSVDGSIGPGNTITARGAAALMRANSNAHFADFVESLVAVNLAPASLRDGGFLGSVLFVFVGQQNSGAGAVTARFYNALGAGFVGVSLKGREVTVNEPQSLVAVVSDTRASTDGAPKMYPNLFINNTGLTPNGVGIAGPISVEVSAVANSTGQPIGTPVMVNDLGPGRTASIGQVLNALQIPAGADSTVIIRARVISGNAAIQGVISQVDTVTRDGAVFEMSRADF